MTGRRNIFLVLAVTVPFLVLPYFPLTREAYRLAHFLQRAVPLLVVLAVAGPWLLRRVQGPERARRTLFRLTLLAATLGLGLTAAEFAVRLAFRDITTTFDNSSYWAVRWNRRHVGPLNAAGFREREYARQPAPGTYRIAVIGDSLTFGQGIPVEARFTELLERRLNQEHAARYEVLNFGWPGHEMRDHVRVLREAVLPAHPDFVVLQWFINDVEDPDARRRPQPRALVPSAFLASLLHRHSALYCLVNMQWANQQERWGWLEPYAASMQGRFGDPTGPGWQQAEETLAAFFESCRAAKVEVGVVLFPQLVDRLIEEYPLGFLMDHMVVACAAADVPCVDLRKPLAQVRDTRALWVNRLDAHPNARANQIAAETIYEAFGPLWWSAAGPAPASAGAHASPQAAFDGE